MIGKTDGVICSTVRLDVGGHLPAGGADAVPGELLGAAHVGAGAEIDGQVAAAADGLGAHAGDADHRADRLLQRHGDLHLHVAQVQAGLLGHDGDAREGDFGVDAAGHARGAVDPARGQQGRR